MSTKIYPIGIQNFEKIRNDGYLYIDKTALMYTILITGSIFIRMKVLPLLLYVIIGQKERSICKMPMVREMYGKTMARKWIVLFVNVRDWKLDIRIY